jgi:hypothetical protein
MYCITKTAYHVGISFEVLFYGTLYKHTVTVYYDLISLPCINFMSYVCTVFIKLLFYFIVITCSLSAYCYFNDMFYIHFVGSLAYCKNE